MLLICSQVNGKFLWRDLTRRSPSHQVFFQIFLPQDEGQSTQTRLSRSMWIHVFHEMILVYFLRSIHALNNTRFVRSAYKIIPNNLLCLSQFKKPIMYQQIGTCLWQSLAVDINISSGVLAVSLELSPSKIWNACRNRQIAAGNKEALWATYSYNQKSVCHLWLQLYRNGRNAYHR